MPIKRYILILTILFICISPWQAGSAQTEIQLLDNKFSILELDLRPHFDQPDVLVIYHMVLSMDEKLPATVEIRLPEDVVKPTSVQAVDPLDGGLNSLQYSTRKIDDWTIVTFVATTREINFEYHEPALIRNGSQLRYQYNWLGDYSIENLSIYIEQPVGSTNMMITPNLGSTKTNQQGVTYFYSQIGKITPGTQFSLGIQYEKEDDSLSKSQLPILPADPLNENTEGRTTLMELAPWLIGIVLVLAIGAFTWWLWVLKSSPRQKGKSHRHRPSLPSFNQDADRVYCHECGQRAVKGDVYCRVCGSKLRKA
jgi:hypothetical protein